MSTSLLNRRIVGATAKSTFAPRGIDVSTRVGSP
jgi:hypothetical protein